ncbi:MAG: N-acetylmuramoyl-L-alanine amidase [Candidatus Paceibacterota bacterium]|jgi:hypothetical protein
MASNVQVLKDALKILSNHGTEVKLVSGWETRDGSKRNDLVPEAVVVHHTGDPSTPLSIIRDGKPSLVGPLANFLVGQSGNIYLVAAGYSNNAGYGGQANFNKAKAGKLTAEVKPPTSDGSWSANGHAWGIEGDGVGNWPAIVRQHVIEVTAALHIAEGWTGARVIAHKELTKRKPGDPGDDMGKVREDVLKLIAAWTDAPTPPPPPPTPDPEPVPSTDHEVVIATYNAQEKRFGGGPYNKDAAVLRDVIKPTVVLGQEVQEIARDQILKYNEFDKVYPVNDVAVFFPSSEFTWGPSIPLTFDDKGVQGAVAVELTSKKNGGKFVVCSVHVRPNDAIRGTAAQKLKGKTNDVHAVIDLLAKYPNVVVGGDWSTEKARNIILSAGYCQVTPNTATYKTFKLDGLYVKGNIIPADDGKTLKTDASDHAATFATLLIPAN